MRERELVIQFKEEEKKDQSVVSRAGRCVCVC